MKLNKRMMRIVTYGLLVIMFFGYSIPAHAWTYQIRWGDSLYKLSRRFGTDVATLKAVNKLSGDRIRAGGKLWIPDAPKQARAQASTLSKVNNGDLYLLARLINGEARGETFTGQVAVGAVILNRVKSGKFPKTIAGNIYKAGEFESVAKLMKEVGLSPSNSPTFLSLQPGGERQRNKNKLGIRSLQQAKIGVLLSLHEIQAQYLLGSRNRF